MFKDVPILQTFSWKPISAFWIYTLDIHYHPNVDRRRTIDLDCTDMYVFTYCMHMYMQKFNVYVYMCLYIWIHIWYTFSMYNYVHNIHGSPLTKLLCMFPKTPRKTQILQLWPALTYPLGMTFTVCYCTYSIL